MQSNDNPWSKEVTETLEKIVKFGFSINQKDIGRIFLDELKINTKYPQPRGTKIKNQVKDLVEEYLTINNYELNYGVWFHPVRENHDILHSIQDLPEFTHPSKLWEQICDLSLSCPQVSYKWELPKYLDFKGKKIIEIGPGRHPRIEVLERGAIEYIGVDPFTEFQIETDEKIKFERIDGLSYLLNQEPNSAIILSFYVQQIEVTMAGNTPFLKGPSLERADYYRKAYKDALAETIAKVTSPGGFVYHGIGYDAHEWDMRYQKAGLKKDENEYGLFLKR